jgi:tetratricopeptide (TPR) repeat protein
VGDQWYRNTDWNADIEKAFVAKLARARDKQQYLRIQACMLANAHPHVALRLLDQYFALGDGFDHAQAYADRAAAYLSLGEIDRAIKSYEDALAVEATRPDVTTQASLDLPFLIATKKLRDRYQRAISLLEQFGSRPTFPVDVFRRHAAQALIALDSDRRTEAREHARLALAAAERDSSGFRYHAKLGLVGSAFEELRAQLSAVAQ